MGTHNRVEYGCGRVIDTGGAPGTARVEAWINCGDRIGGRSAGLWTLHGIFIGEGWFGALVPLAPAPLRAPSIPLCCGRVVARELTRQTGRSPWLVARAWVGWALPKR